MFHPEKLIELVLGFGTNGGRKAGFPENPAYETAQDPQNHEGVVVQSYAWNSLQNAGRGMWMLLATLLLSSCYTPECSVEQASYIPLTTLCNSPPVPDDLLDFAATVREMGGVVFVGSLATSPSTDVPWMHPESCANGICISEARVRGTVLVRDALSTAALTGGDEVLIGAPLSRTPLFVSDESGIPLCGLGEDWRPSPRMELSRCYNLVNFLMPRAGDLMVFFVSGTDEHGVRTLQWGAQVAGVSVSGRGTLSGRDVGLYELEAF